MPPVPSISANLPTRSSTQDAGSALNNEVKSQVIGELDREKLPGKTIEVVGAFQLINPANWMVTPVRFKVAP